jgi:hypothetical protein
LDTLIEILLHSLPHNGATGHPWFFDPIKLQVPKKWELFLGGGNRVSAADNSLLGTKTPMEINDFRELCLKSLHKRYTEAE